MPYLVAALLLVLGTLSATAQDRRPSHCFAIAQMTPEASYVHKASWGQPVDDEFTVRLSYLNHSMYLIQTHGGLHAVTDYTGVMGPNRLLPDVVTMNNAHSSHWTPYPDPDIPHALEGWWQNGQPADHYVDLGEMLVRNATTGRAGVQTIEVEVPEYGEGSPVLLPPFFIEPSGSWLLVREPARQGAGDSVVYPFTVGGRPYVPAARPVVRDDEPWPLCLVAYNLWSGDFAIESRVVDSQGAPQQGGRLQGIERTVTGLEGVDKLSAMFLPEDLEAGSYFLEIDLQDPRTGQAVSSTIAFEVAAASGQSSISSGSGR